MPASTLPTYHPSPLQQAAVAWADGHAKSMKPTIPTEVTWHGRPTPQMAQEAFFGDLFALGEPQTSCTRADSPTDPKCPDDYYELIKTDL